MPWTMRTEAIGWPWAGQLRTRRSPSASATRASDWSSALARRSAVRLGSAEAPFGSVVIAAILGTPPGTLRGMSVWSEVGDRVWVRRYAFYDQNIGVVMGDDGVLVIDTRISHRQADEILTDL